MLWIWIRSENYISEARQEIIQKQKAQTKCIFEIFKKFIG